MEQDIYHEVGRVFNIPLKQKYESRFTFVSPAFY